MAELVDARDSKSRDCEVMGVRFPLPAPSSSPEQFQEVQIILLKDASRNSEDKFNCFFEDTVSVR
jgi:hypothetical protein